MNFLSPDIKDLKQLGKNKQKEYANAKPFPNIVLDSFFNEEMLSQVLTDFPDLSKKRISLTTIITTKKTGS
ncbi:hypothetical protein [Mucilaginibacter antarcticus]|uniref:hypothetical protein n=1 Tax=Mucilaginibacter antarcticus TaxID=1855725 RepID=UPI00363939E3